MDVTFAMSVMSYEEETPLLQLKRRAVVLQILLSGRAILKFILYYN